MTDSQSPINVPLLDLKAQYESLRAEIEPAMREVVESQWFIMGPKVQQLEQEIAAYCDCKHAVGCASGSDAILLVLMALGIGPSDDVICPTYTFFATAGSIHRLGARPVFADIDPVTYNMTPETAREAAARCRNLKAIMPVHLFGQCVDMDGLLALGDELGVPIIDDAAQAIGARDATGAIAGSRGMAGCFSFFPSKNLGGFGDGGIITTNDDSLADAMRKLRNHGMDPKYYHALVGLNSRLDALQAAVLSVKLRYLDDWHAARARNAAQYDRMFHDAGAATSDVPMNGDSLPLRTPWRPDKPARHIYNQYVIAVPDHLRDELRQHMTEQKIGTEIYYPVPMHEQECFADLGMGLGDLPHAERAARQTIALPIYPELTMEQKRHVANTIIAFVAKHAAATAGSAAR